MKGLNWRSWLRDANQAVGCWQAKVFSPGCLMATNSGAFWSSPKVKGR